MSAFDNLKLTWCPRCGQLFGWPDGMAPNGICCQCLGYNTPAKTIPVSIVATHRGGVTDQGMVDITLRVSE